LFLVLHLLKCYSTDPPPRAERPAEPAVAFDDLIQLLRHISRVEQGFIEDPQWLLLPVPVPVPISSPRYDRPLNRVENPHPMDLSEDKCALCAEHLGKGLDPQPGHFVLVCEQDRTERGELVDNRLDAGLRGERARRAYKGRWCVRGWGSVGRGKDDAVPAGCASDIRARTAVAAVVAAWRNLKKA
jgi:hypothetical protein